MAAWRKRIGRMGNHYANEASLNHTVPAIICWEKPRLLGSLAGSTEGTYFWARTLLLPLFFLSRFCSFLFNSVSVFFIRSVSPMRIKTLVDRHLVVNFQGQSSQLGTAPIFP